MLYSGEVPEIIRFGRGVHKMWQELLLPGKVLFVCGGHSLARINEAAKSAKADFRCAAVSGELPLAELENILVLARKCGYRNIIGWGGGSAMDCAKAVAAVLPSLRHPIISRPKCGQIPIVALWWLVLALRVCLRP